MNNFKETFCVRHKLLILVGSLLIFFSFQTQGQKIDTVKSVHPKMDKYYPQPLKTRTLYAADSSQPSPTKPIVGMKPAPSVTKTPVAQGTVINAASAIKPNGPPSTQSEIPPAPAVSSTLVTVEPSRTAVTASDTVSAPQTISINKPAQPAPITTTSHYVDPASLFTTRLGSSSPQYDTWEKNNNGAGAVSTHSK